MTTRVIQKNVHISPRHAGLVCDLIRGKDVKAALVILQNTEKKTASILIKLLNSAIANATNNHKMNADKLYVYQALANQGVTIKRTLPRAKGSANLLRKRHSHLEIILSDDAQQKTKDFEAMKARIAKRNQHKGKEAVIAKPVKTIKTITKQTAKIQKETKKEANTEKGGNE
jgi:ribosomal protein L22